MIDPPLRESDGSSLSWNSGSAFRFGDGAVAVLLIHGLTGTPTEVKETGKALARAGYTTYGMQLSGHCGTEADLLATGWRDWLQSALTAFDAIRRDHETVFVGGLSMGALLSLLIAAERPGQVAGCLCYSPTMFYDGWSVPKASKLLHIALMLGFGRFLRFRENFPYGIKNKKLRMRVLTAMKSGNSSEAGSLYFPGQSLRQLLKLIGYLKRCLPDVRSPTLVLHAREDDLTSIENAGYIVGRTGGRAEKIFLEDSYHMITIDQERDLVAEHSVAFIRRIAPAIAEVRRNVTSLVKT
jgi:carboxylesterase